MRTRGAAPRPRGTASASRRAGGPSSSSCVLNAPRVESSLAGVDIFSSVRFVAGFEESKQFCYDQTVTKPFNNIAYLPILI
jgi:hypothetical protein